jgi:ABC-type antimicrobial peptide transport system permease subunit
MDEVMGSSTARQKFNMLLLTVFGAVALVLAAIGIYGFMAYTVAQRNREIGIRMALGASRPTIRRLVMWSGMRLALAGMAVGALAAFALTRLMASFLFDVRPWDPVAFVSAPLILGVVALVAVWVPGIRASRIDPVEALRTE